MNSLKLEGFTLIFGPPGAGKTALALHAAASGGGRALYIGLYESKERVERKLDYLGLDKSRFSIYDFINVPDYAAVLNAATDLYFKERPDAVVIDGVNYFPQNREVASALYRLFDVPVIAVGEEPTIQTPIAYIADNLISVEQFFKAGARYRLLRFLKSRLGPPPGSEFYFAIMRRGLVVVEPWHPERVSQELAAELPMKRAVFVRDVEETVRAVAPFYRRLGIFKGARVGDFICDGPDCVRVAAAFMCDYSEAAEAAPVSTYKALESVAKAAGCDAKEAVVSSEDLRDDRGLEALRDAVGEAKVLYFFGLEEVLVRMGAERVQLILDFLNSVRPDLAILAIFKGVQPTPELLTMFNTVWRIEPRSAVVVKSMFGWPVRDFDVVEKEGVYYFLPRRREA